MKPAELAPGAVVYRWWDTGIVGRGVVDTVDTQVHTEAMMQNKPRVQALMGNADGVPQLASEVARALDMSSSTARKYLEELVSEGQASRSRGQVFRHGRYCPAVYYRPVEVSA